MQCHKALKILSHMTNYEDRDFVQIFTPNFVVYFQKYGTYVSKREYDKHPLITLTPAPFEVSVQCSDYANLIFTRYNGSTLLLRNVSTDENIIIDSPDVWFQLSTTLDLRTHEMIMVPEELKVLKDIKIGISTLSNMNHGIYDALIQFSDEFLNNNIVKGFINEEE